MVTGEEESCPLCASKKESGELTLFQVNMGQALKLCSRKECPYPLGTKQKAIPIVNRNASDIAIKKRKISSISSSRSSTCSTSSGSRCSTPVESLNNWSPGLASPEIPPALMPPCTTSGYISSPPPPTRVVTLKEPVAHQCVTPPAHVRNVAQKPSCLQWRNKEALCCLDVVLCLLVHCKQLRKLFNSTNTNEQSVLRTLIAAYDQAQSLLELINSSRELSPDKTANLETSVGTITVKTGGGDLSPVACLTNSIGCAQIVSSPSVQQTNDDDDDDFFKCLDDLDLDAESTKFDIQSLEDLLDGKLDSPVKSQKSPIRLPIQRNTLPTVSAGNSDVKNSEICLAEASLLLEDVREQVWQSISSKLRCQKGRDDSPVFALPLLLQESQTVVDLFSLSFTWCLTCNYCGHRHENPIQKILTTFPNTPQGFTTTAPFFIRDCFNCGANHQQMNLIYNRLPKTIMMHFVEGLPDSMTWSSLDFTQDGRMFKVTGVVQFKTHPDHFVAWLRDPVSNNWMECDDIKSAQCHWSSIQPEFDMKQTHIVMWEEWSSDDANLLHHNFGFIPLNPTQTSSGFGPVNFSETSAALSSKPHVQSKELIAPVPDFTQLKSSASVKNIQLDAQVTNGSGNFSDIVPAESAIQQKKPACTPELVRQLVLNSKKSSGKDQSSQGCPSLAGFISKSLPGSRDSSPGQLLQPALPKLQVNMIGQRKSSKRPTVIVLDKAQNDARLKRVRENLMRLKEERDWVTASSTQSTLNAVEKIPPTVGKIPSTVSSTAAKILSSSVQEKPYLEAIQPFLKKRSSTSETQLMTRIGKEQSVFKGYSSKKAAAAKTTPSKAGQPKKPSVTAKKSLSLSPKKSVTFNPAKITPSICSANNIKESGKQATSRMSVTKAGNQLTVFKTSSNSAGLAPSSSAILAAGIPVVISHPGNINKRTEQIAAGHSGKVAPKTGQPKKPSVSAKKSLSLSPKKSVTFNPAKTVEFVSGEKTRIVIKSSTDAALRIRDGSPAAKRGRRKLHPTHSPKLSPRREMLAVTNPELGMKRHTPTHVLKRLASPPRSKYIDKSSDFVLSKTEHSTESRPSHAEHQVTDKKQNAVNKVSSPDRLGAYLQGRSPSPKRKYKPYSYPQRLKQLRDEDDAHN